MSSAYFAYASTASPDIAARSARTRWSRSPDAVSIWAAMLSQVAANPPTAPASPVRSFNQPLRGSRCSINQPRPAPISDPSGSTTVETASIATDAPPRPTASQSSPCSALVRSPRDSSSIVPDSADDVWTGPATSVLVLTVYPGPPCASGRRRPRSRSPAPSRARRHPWHPRRCAQR